MLNEASFVDWSLKLGLTEMARAAIASVRSRNPARHVGGGRQNVSGRYPSRKMGFTIQFESHRVELPLVYELEHDPEVLEYYDQPPSIPLAYPAENGRRLSIMHTPDYFVIRTNCAGWVECKTEADLEKLTIKNPHRYTRDADGNWRCPPGEDYASAHGLDYTVWSSEMVDWTLQRNLHFLEDYLRSDVITINASRVRAIKTIVAAEAGISLLDLMAKLQDVAEPDALYALIANGELYVDLSAAVIAEPGRVHVYVDEQAATVHQEVPSAPHTDPRKRGRTEVPHDEVFPLLAAASERDLEAANRRFAIVKQHLEGVAEQPPISERTLRYWVARYRTAESQYGNGYVGLLVRRKDRGNRTSRLPDESRRLLIQLVENDYESLRQKNKFASWSALKRRCDELNVEAPSYVTFCTAVNRRPVFQQALKRRGRRAAYTHSAFYFELEPTTPRHGDRPFEICHVDHTELDIEVVCSHTGRPLGRPWMTVLIDAFSRRCLALYLTFDEPSYRSCMMIMRDCVRRHLRLPQVIVLDGGAEFQSTYFETLLARYECTKKVRPPAQARFGSVCERLFGTTNTRFVHNLQGNTQITRNVRQVTKSNNPAGQARWTLGCLYEYLSRFLFEIYDTVEHPVLGQTPRDAFVHGLRSAGSRPNRTIPYDQSFLLATLPTTSRGTSTVSPGRGVTINRVYYWSEVFRDPTVENHDVPIRYDPFDIGIAYAFVKNHWTECHSEHYTALQGRSEREIMLASKELRRRARLHSQERFSLTARKLADFLDSAEAEEKCLLQRLRDRESASLRQNGLASLSLIEGDEESVAKPLSKTTMLQMPSPPVRATSVYGDF